MSKFAICIEYDGGFFYGIQTQKELPTIQSHLESAFQILCKKNIKLEMAGRTDTGVHAQGMICSFSMHSSSIKLGRFLHSLNALTPREIAIHSIVQVPDEFHACFSCNEREYEYWIYNAKYMSPLLKNRAYHFPFSIEMDKILEQIPYILGEHDFASLSKKESLHLRRTTIRKITKFEVVQSAENPNLYKIQIRANGFLHNMVRILVGTLIDISRGKLKSSSMDKILDSMDRTKAGITIPSFGLYFKRAYYYNYPMIDELYTWMSGIS